MSKPLRVVFMGTPDFAVPTLKILLAHPDVVSVLAVYTQPDRPAGRGLDLKPSPIKKLAEEKGLPLFQPENINAGDEPRRLADFLPDVVVVIAYAQFLGRAILNIPRLGCVNVHSSLLPKYRGAAPIQYAVLNGETETGITTMRLVPKMDAGPILLQNALSITPTMTGQELHDALAELGATTLLYTLEGLRDGKLRELEQDESQATYAKIIKKEDGKIDWTQGSSALINRMRAFTPWPGLYAPSNRGTLKIHEAFAIGEPGHMPVDQPPGAVMIDEDSIYVKCGDGWLDLRVVQLEGKKPMTAELFVNGIKNSKEKFRFL